MAVHGSTLNLLIVVHFAVVVVLMRLADRRTGADAEEASPAPSDESVILGEIRDEPRRRA